MAHYSWTRVPDRPPDGVAPGEIVVVFPLAATEQHGPHLPLSTDSDIAGGLMDLAMGELPENINVATLPVEKVGASMEHSRFTGTAYVTTPALMGRIVSVAAQLAELGVSKLVLITSHGGNIPAMMAAALEARSQFDLLAVTTSWSRLGYPAGLIDEGEVAVGIHGGLIETSLMLHFRPDLVNMAAAAQHSSLQLKLQERYELLRAYGPVGFGWLAEDLNPSGVVGDPRDASSETGAQIADFQSQRFINLLQEIADANIDELITSIR